MKNNYSKAFLALLIAAGLSGSIRAQDVYNVEPINYQVYPASLPLQFTTDDVYSDTFTIPFNFTFFGNTYNQFRVSTNGYINFTPGLSGGSPWSLYPGGILTNAAFTVPDTNFPTKNSILGCYHDMDNSMGTFGGAITWSVTGDAPYRRFVLMYSHQPHFGTQCMATKQSSFQIILYETLNTIEVQITRKDLCTSWQNGVAVIGLINDTGLLGYTAPGRNTSAWQVEEGNGEGWRFRPDVAPVYRYIKCDPENDGFEAFDFAVIQDDLGASAVIYETQQDAADQVNALPGTSYINTTASQQTVYARVNDEIIPVLLSTVDCSLLFDNDNVAAMDEDLNGDGNLANDDTDGDGLPDFADNDDDGDLVLTSEEYIFGRDADDTLWDTDNDGIPNYLDSDDDGDGLLTADEDYNHDGNASNDDIDNSGVADYLEMSVTMGVVNPALQNAITLYPNPVSNILNISNTTGRELSDIAVYSVNGVKVKQAKTTTSLDVSDLQSGIYIIRIEAGSQMLNYKFVKK